MPSFKSFSYAPGTANMASIIVFNGLTWYRVVQCFLGGTVFGLAIGRSLLYMLFWAINLILLLTNVKLEAEYVCPHYLCYAQYNMLMESRLRDDLAGTQAFIFSLVAFLY